MTVSLLPVRSTAFNRAEHSVSLYDAGMAPDEDEEAASGREAEPLRQDGSLERSATDGGGAYWRDRDGVWRYADSRDAVPGARDLRLRDLFDPPLHMITGDDGEERPTRLVPRAWARRAPGHPLTWVYDFATLGGRDDIAVPAAAWDERAGTVVAMTAPELHPHNLQGVEAVAELLAVTASTVRAYLARGQMPEPVVRVGRTPVWSRPVIERWLPARRRHATAHRPPTTGGSGDAATTGHGDDPAS